jgi:hypothetical protein
VNCPRLDVSGWHDTSFGGNGQFIASRYLCSGAGIGWKKQDPVGRGQPRLFYINHEPIRLSIARPIATKAKMVEAEKAAETDSFIQGLTIKFAANVLIDHALA